MESRDDSLYCFVFCLFAACSGDFQMNEFMEDDQEPLIRSPAGRRVRNLELDTDWQFMACLWFVSRGFFRLQSGRDAAAGSLASAVLRAPSIMNAILYTEDHVRWFKTRITGWFYSFCLPRNSCSSIGLVMRSWFCLVLFDEQRFHFSRLSSTPRTLCGIRSTGESVYAEM